MPGSPSTSPKAYPSIQFRGRLPAPVTAIRDQQIYSYTTRLNFDDVLSPTLILHAGAGYVRYLNSGQLTASVLDYNAVSNLGLVGGP